MSYNAIKYHNKDNNNNFNNQVEKISSKPSSGKFVRLVEFLCAKNERGET